MSATEKTWFLLAALGLVILGSVWSWDFVVLSRQLHLPTVTDSLRSHRWLDPLAVVFCFVPGGLILGHLYGAELERLAADFLLGGALVAIACLLGALYLS